jgi:hypothetical protein
MRRLRFAAAHWLSAPFLPYQFQATLPDGDPLVQPSRIPFAVRIMGSDLRYERSQER